MTTISSILKIYYALKPILFNSQVIFYNLLFNFTKDLDTNFLSSLTINIEKLLSTNDFKQFLNSPITKEYYKKLLNTVEDIDSIFPSIKSNSINSDTLRADINATMHKNNASAIPKYWRQTYLLDSQYSVYKDTLTTVLVYYLLMYHYEKIDHNHSTSINNITLLPIYWDELTQKISTSVVPIETLNSLTQLTSIIINQIYKQCEQKPISSLQNQKEFYMSHVECYGARNIDKFYALERYSLQNVYCAYELANIYYYGSLFYVGQIENAVEIPKDYFKAAHYYKLCTDEPNIIIAACWSLGYMYQTKRITSTSDNLEEASKFFKKCGNYPPALSNLGLIEKTLGDKILFSKENYSLLDPIEKEKCKNHYLSFIEFSYSACCNDWVYAFNNLYSFYFLPKYIDIRTDLQNNNTYINLDPIYLLQQAADKKNYWAMDNLSLHYICDFLWDNNVKKQEYINKENLLELLIKGKITLQNAPSKLTKKLPPILQKAKSMLKELNAINYARGTFHLAINFYYSSPLMGNLLKKASDQGYELAKTKLEEIMKLY